MDLWLIFPPLLAGIAIGYYDIWPEVIRKVEGPLARLSLLLLLGLMGTKIGSDGEVLSRLGDIGIQSLLIAAASILGSVLILKVITPLLDHITTKEEGFDAVSPKMEFKLTASILLVLIAGGWLGYTIVPPEYTGSLDSIITYTLGLLLLAVGISLGLNKNIFNQVARVGWRILLLPLGIALGSIIGPLAIGFFLRL
ncbi:MAG: LysO family transporter, partial [Candidatus Bipolaricaulota bacterium]